MRIEQASTKYLLELEKNIRDEDRKEVEVTTSVPLTDTMEALIKRSEEAYVAVHDDKLVAIFGVVEPSFVGGVGAPWVLSTKEVEKHKKTFMWGSKQILKSWMSKYPVLVCFIDARYKKALNWAKWMGFTIYPSKAYGESGLPFHRAEIRR